MSSSPEANMKRRMDRAFDHLFGKKSRDTLRTPMAGGNSEQKNGMPDRYYATGHSPEWRGTCWIESKVDTKLSEIQRLQCERLSSSGEHVYVARWNRKTDLIEIQQFHGEKLGPVEQFNWETIKTMAFWQDLMTREVEWRR